MIEGRMPGLNEYVAAERAHRLKAAKMKRRWQDAAAWAAMAQLGTWKPRTPVTISYLWVEGDRRRDKDNVCAFGRKVIQDALVEAGYLPDDGWDEIAGFEDRFTVDKKRPRVVVTVRGAE